MSSSTKEFARSSTVKSGYYMLQKEIEQSNLLTMISNITNVLKAF